MAWHRRLPRFPGGGIEPRWGCRCKPGGGAGLGVDLGQAEREPGQPRVALAGDGIPADVERCRDSPQTRRREGGREGEMEGAAVAPPHTGSLREVRGELGRSRAPGSSPQPRVPQPLGRGEGKKGSRRRRYCSFLSLRRSNAIVQSY